MNTLSVGNIEERLKQPKMPKMVGLTIDEANQDDRRVSWVGGKRKGGRCNGIQNFYGEVW